MVIFAGLAAFAKVQIDRKFEWRYPALNELVPSEHYMEDLSALLLGSRRVAADLAYIQLLQYYGVPEEGHEHEDEGHGQAGHIHRFEAGEYAALKEKGARIMRLDPFFSRAILEVAGALAFNQKRVGESLDLLKEAIARNPFYFRYHLYVSAILFVNTGQEQKLIDVLLEAIKYPDCPVVLEGVLANLLKKNGRFEEAAQIYIHTSETAADAGARKGALENLEALVRAHPEVGRKLLQRQ